MEDIPKQNRNRRTVHTGKRNNNAGSNDRVRRKRKNKNLQQNDASDEKILNTSFSFETYMHVCQAFENVLNEMEIDNNMIPFVVKKLQSVRKAIEKRLKILSVSDGVGELNEKNVSKISGMGSKEKNINKSKLSLRSEDSIHSNVGDSYDELMYTKFTENVNCPFCSETQIDKFNLIEHIDNNCKACQMELFREPLFKPMSEIQILPNSTFKCNICHNFIMKTVRQLFSHKNKDEHIKASSLISSEKKKTYTEALFCSCCKIFVSNNYTEIDFHINHIVHIRNSKKNSSFDYARNKNISMVYLNNKKFRCLLCPQKPTFRTTHEAATHLLINFHKNKCPENVYLFCEFCEVMVNETDMQHFVSSLHKQKEVLKSAEEHFKLCLYCGLKCKNLKELYEHMTKSCTNYIEIKEGLRYKIRDGIEGTGSSNKAKLKNTETKTNYVFVKGEVEVPKVCSRLKDFGEIINLETCDDGWVKFEFKDESSVKMIMLLKGLIEVDGVKLEVSDVLEEDYSDCDDESDESDSAEESDSNEDENNFAYDDKYLENLFSKATSHLVTSAKETNSHDEDAVALTCKDTLECSDCVSVGFQACGLALPSESLSFFCEFKETEFEKKLQEEFSIFQTLEKYKAKLIEKTYVRLKSSDLWKDVEIGSMSFLQSIPHIKCTHKKTDKMCKIIFFSGTVSMTEMLRKCLEKSKLAQPFFFIVRFWFSVHDLFIGKLDYVLMSLLIFFLISRQIVTLPAEESATRKKIHFIMERENLNTDISSDNQDEEMSTVVALFQKFLQFLLNFDYKTYIICLPIPFPIPKYFFNLKEYQILLNLYDTKLIKSSSLCVLDPTCQINLAAAVKNHDLDSMLKVVEKTIKCKM